MHGTVSGSRVLDAALCAAGAGAGCLLVGVKKQDALQVTLATAAVLFLLVAYQRGQLLERVKDEILLPMVWDCEQRGDLPPGSFLRLVNGR
jgi:hypothetical protein